MTINSVPFTELTEHHCLPVLNVPSNFTTTIIRFIKSQTNIGSAEMVAVDDWIIT